MKSNILDQQIAVVTGAATGLGLAVAKKMSAAGAVVLMIDIDNLQLQKAAGELPGKHQLFAIDVTNEQTVADTMQLIASTYSRIDILVNCAGITGITGIKSHDVDAANLQKVFAVNFMGSWFTSKHVLPVMLTKNYGRVLHFASIAGKEGNAGMLAYSSSKAAVIGMTKVQGKEYAETGITVNAIAPAVIQTALVSAMPPEQVKYMTDKIPMKRCGTLEEVADMVLYIVSPANSFTTGFVFDLSGGRATY